MVSTEKSLTRKDKSLPHSDLEAESDGVEAARSGMRVAASPFNGVKLDLAIIIVLLLLIWLVLANTVKDTLTQTMILFACSGLAASWIIFRVRRILYRHEGG